jgi:hypothetical protein
MGDLRTVTGTLMQLARLNMTNNKVTSNSDQPKFDRLVGVYLRKFTEFYYNTAVDLNELGRIVDAATQIHDQINVHQRCPVDTDTAEESNLKFGEVYATARKRISRITSRVASFRYTCVNEWSCFRMSKEVFEKVMSTMLGMLDALVEKCKNYVVYLDAINESMILCLERSSAMPSEELGNTTLEDICESARDKLVKEKHNDVDDTSLIFLREFLSTFYNTVCGMSYLDGIVQWQQYSETRICGQANAAQTHRKYDACMAQLNHANHAIINIDKMINTQFGELDIVSVDHLHDDLFAMCRDSLYLTRKQLTWFNVKLMEIEHTIRDDLHYALESVLERRCFSDGRYEHLILAHEQDAVTQSSRRTTRCDKYGPSRGHNKTRAGGQFRLATSAVGMSKRDQYATSPEERKGRNVRNARKARKVST